MSIAVLPRAIRQHHPVVSQVRVVAVNDAYLCFAVQCAARKLGQLFDRALAPLGLTNGQFSMLSFVVGLDRTTVGDLAQKLAMEHSTVSAAIKTLLGRGLVSTKPDVADKRQRFIYATAEGRSLVTSALPVWLQHHHALSAGLGPEVMRSLLHNLSKISDE
jgi:DNA-binding MarR family transcriptional regulator